MREVHNRSRPRGIAAARAIALLAFVGVIVSGVALLVVPRLGVSRPPTAPTPAGPNLPIEMTFGEFNLTDQDGSPITQEALDGQWTVVDFIFTSCPLYCPTMTAQMKRVQDETAGTRLRFLSISIDGEHDTPEVLKSFAALYGADPARWRFATGPDETTWRLASEDLAFNVGLSETQQVTMDDGSTRAFIDHPTRLLLVGPDRTVRGMYSYNDPAEIDRLIADARFALESFSPGQGETDPADGG